MEHDYEVGNKIKDENGRIGTVVLIENNNSFIGVEFESETGYDHDCDGNGRQGYCEYVYPSDIAHI